MMSRARKVTLGCFGVFVIAAAAFLFSARPLLFPAHYEVVSIKQTSQYQDRQLLARAFAASPYRAANIVYQPNGSFCGPTSIANVARTLGDADATPEQVVAGTDKCNVGGICWGGISLDELARLTERFTHHRVIVRRNLDLQAFRDVLRLSNDPSKRVILNFNRGPLFGTDGGHHSPVGGYLVDEDLVLVLDVNRKYQPWLVSSERLFTAMDTIDESTHQKRGVLLIE